MGQPELEQRLDQPQLRQLKQRITLRCRLTPLPSDEVGSYINCRLKTAGYEGKELFEPKAVESWPELARHSAPNQCNLRQRAADCLRIVEEKSISGDN